MESVKAYKLARPNGWDIYTGATVNYRKNIGKIVKWSQVNTPKDLSIQRELSSALRWPLGVNTEISMYKELFIHKVNFASANPNDCWLTDHWVYAYANDFITSWQKPTKYPFPTLSRSCDVSIPTINCSAYRVEGVPVCEEKRKWGFEELKVVEEIKDLDSLFGWKHSEAMNPINPLKRKAEVTREDIELLRSWNFVYQSVLSSIDGSVRSLRGDLVEIDFFCSVYDSIEKLVGKEVYDLIWRSLLSFADSATIKVWNADNPRVLWYMAPPNERHKNPVYDSFGASCYAYIGSLFPNIKKWQGIKHEEGKYPYQPAADLWRRGLVPSFDGSSWRLHSGKEAEVVYKE